MTPWAMSGYLWMIRRYGLRLTWRYERERRRLQRIYGPFNPVVHGEHLLTFLGATDEQIMEAKRQGLA